MLPMTLAIPAPIPALPMLALDGALFWLLLAGSVAVGFVVWALCAARTSAALTPPGPRPEGRRPPAMTLEKGSLAA